MTLLSHELAALDAADQLANAGLRWVRAEELSRRIAPTSRLWWVAHEQRQHASHEFFRIAGIAYLIFPDEAAEAIDAILDEIEAIHRRHEAA